ncbi:hypothetical protein D1007_19738 [Hordeum vulgare]|nr:hypothetical protein D1007_19738 [Hordeum vulgare]
MPRLARLHAEEVSRRRRLLTPEQRLNPAYAADSPHSELWFAVEHEEQRRCGMRDVQPGGPRPPPPFVSDDQEAESEEEEQRKANDEEVVYQQWLAEAIALSVADDCVVPPPSKTEPTEPQEVYQWTG